MVKRSLLCMISTFFMTQALDRELVQSYKNPRARAFLDMIAYAEGTAHDLGYRTQYTGVLFDSYKDHPRTVMTGILKGKEVRSSAAGRYQFLTKTWNEIAPRIEAQDFSPIYQDYAALELIRKNGALADILSGKIGIAIKKLNKTWASFSGSPYGQPTKPLDELKIVYLSRLAAHKKYTYVKY